MDLIQRILTGEGKLLPEQKTYFNRKIKDIYYDVYLSDLYIENLSNSQFDELTISGFIISDIKLISIDYTFLEGENKISSIDLTHV